MAINLKTIAAAALAALLTASCGSEVRVPDNATPTQEAANIFPEYRDIYIPQNIAPLNVQIPPRRTMAGTSRLPAPRG